MLFHPCVWVFLSVYRVFGHPHAMPDWGEAWQHLLGAALPWAGGSLFRSDHSATPAGNPDPGPPGSYKLTVQITVFIHKEKTDLQMFALKCILYIHRANYTIWPFKWTKWKGAPAASWIAFVPTRWWTLRRPCIPVTSQHPETLIPSTQIHFWV